MKRLILAATTALCAATAAPAQTKLAVGYAPIAETAAVFAAQDRGYFREHGLEVTLTRVGTEAISAVFGGSVQISSAPTSSFLQAVDGGLALQLVSACGVTAPRTAKSVALVARSGVTLAAPEDLAGKKIGAPGIGGLLEVLFQRWMQQKGVDTARVTEVEIQIPNTVDVLRTGSVDGIVAGEPFVSRAVAAGVGQVAFNFMADLPAGIPYSVMVAKTDFIAAQPETVKAFRAAVAQGAELATSDPAAMQEVIAKFTGLPLEVVRKVELPECRTVPDAKALDWLIQTMRAQKRLQTDVNAAALIAP